MDSLKECLINYTSLSHGVKETSKSRLRKEMGRGCWAGQVTCSPLPPSWAFVRKGAWAEVEGAVQRSLCDPVQAAAQRETGMWEEKGAFPFLCTELAQVLWNRFGASGDKLLAQMSPLSRWALPWRFC